MKKLLIFVEQKKTMTETLKNYTEQDFEIASRLVYQHNQKVGESKIIFVVDLTGAKMESVKLIETDIKDITISPQTDLNNACYLEGQEPQVQQNNKDKSSKLSLLQLLKNNNNDSKMLPIKSGEDCKRPLSEDEKG